jgi:hypothetical protein
MVVFVLLIIQVRNGVIQIKLVKHVVNALQVILEISVKVVKKLFYNQKIFYKNILTMFINTLKILMNVLQILA